MVALLIWSSEHAYDSPGDLRSSRRKSRATPPLSVQRYSARLRDPRLNRRKRHLLIDIIVITLCGIICGADDWQAIAPFARRRQSCLQTFLALRSEEHTSELQSRFG